MNKEQEEEFEAIMRITREKMLKAVRVAINQHLDELEEELEKLFA